MATRPSMVLDLIVYETVTVIISNVTATGTGLSAKFVPRAKGVSTVEGTVARIGQTNYYNITRSSAVGNPAFAPGAYTLTLFNNNVSTKLSIPVVFDSANRLVGPTALIKGNTISNDIRLRGDVYVGSALKVNGLVRTESYIDANNLTARAGGLTVSGASNLNGGASVTGNLAVSGASNLNGGASVTGALNVTAGSIYVTHTMDGDNRVGGNLGVSGNAYLSETYVTTETGGLTIQSNKTTGNSTFTGPRLSIKSAALRNNLVQPNTLSDPFDNAEFRFDETTGDLMIGNINRSVDQSGTLSSYRLFGASLLRSNLFSSWSFSSDARLKENINTIDSALDKVNRLRGVEFNWKVMPNGSKCLGFIAQEVQEVLPNIVNQSGDYLGVASSEIIPVLVNAIKELKAEVDALKAKLPAA